MIRLSLVMVCSHWFSSPRTSPHHFSLLLWSLGSEICTPGATITPAAAAMDLGLLELRDRSQQPEDIHHLRRRMTHEWFDKVQDPDFKVLPDTLVKHMFYSISFFCRDVLRSLDPKARQKEPMSMSLYRLLDSVYTSFITWGDDYDVSSGNLDDALKDSQEIRLFTIKIMIRICETLVDGGSGPNSQ